MKILKDIELKRDESIAAREFDFVIGLFDDNYHGITAAGKTVNKAEAIELLKSTSPYVKFTVEDPIVSVHGNVGVVTGKLTSKSKSGSIIGQSRFLLVYLKNHEQHWKIIESQETIVIVE